MKTFKNKFKQNGVTLVVGVIILFIISLVGVTSMRSSILQEKMASGLKNRQYADSAALIALSEGERFLKNYYLQSNNTYLSPNATNPGENDLVLQPRSNLVYAFKKERNMGTIGHAVTDVNYYNVVLMDKPRYIIEDLDSQVINLGNILYTDVDGEAFGSSSASVGGSVGEGIEVRKFRILSKGIDSSGNITTGFESVISVVSR